MKDHKKSIRKRNILYLIKNYLLDQGFKQTADVLKTEAKLTKDYVVCDNINLEFIVIEFELYYYQRFQVYPQLCRQLGVTAARRPAAHHSSKEQTSSMVNQDKMVNEEADMKIEELDLTIYNSLSKSETGSQVAQKISDSECASDEWKEYVHVILKDAHSHHTRTRWNDIKGLDDVKETLREAVIYPIKYPHLFSGVIQPWKGILLYGPPGTGKTSLAKAVATESAAAFFNVSISSIINKWRGDTEKLIRVLFELAHQYAPSIIFIDEIDALTFKRSTFEHEASRRMKSEIFTQMDNLIQSTSNVFFLATTNTPWDLDEAMARRFEKHIFISLPNSEARKQMLENYLPKVIHTSPLVETCIDYEYGSTLTKNFSGSDIRNLCKDLTITSMKEIFSALESNSSASLKKISKKTIKNEHFESATLKYRPTVHHLLEKYVRWQTNE